MSTTIKFSAHLANIRDLRRILLPPSMVCVSPLKITATWFLTEEITPEDEAALGEMYNLPVGEDNGYRVAFHPTVAYSMNDMVSASKASKDALRMAMSGPCRHFGGVIWRARNDMAKLVPYLSERALTTVVGMPVIAYPREWLNEEITARGFVEQVFRATQESPNSFLWKKSDALWVNTSTVISWWREHYGSRISAAKANAFFDELGARKSRIEIDGMPRICREVVFCDINNNDD